MRESDFETALCGLLPRHGWTEEVIMNPTEDDLIRNWTDIIYSNRGFALTEEVLTILNIQGDRYHQKAVGSHLTINCSGSREWDSNPRPFRCEKNQQFAMR